MFILILKTVRALFILIFILILILTARGAPGMLGAL